MTLDDFLEWADFCSENKCITHHEFYALGHSMKIDLFVELVANVKEIVDLIMQFRIVADFSLDYTGFKEEHLPIIFVFDVQTRWITFKIIKLINVNSARFVGDYVKAPSRIFLIFFIFRFPFFQMKTLYHILDYFKVFFNDE